MRYLSLFLLFLLFACQKKQPELALGRYEVIDTDYTRHQYRIEREFQSNADLFEQHMLDNCIVLDIFGQWKRSSNDLVLKYARQRTRNSCKDSLSEWDTLKSELKIPIRKVDEISFESFLPASSDAREKWLRWQLKKAP